MQCNSLPFRLKICYDISKLQPMQPKRDIIFVPRNTKSVELPSPSGYNQTTQIQEVLNMAFPENLQFLRTRSETTQEQLAEQLGVSRQSVSKWESGLSFPEMDTLIRICDLYDTNLDTLLRGSVEADRVSDSTNYDQFMTRFARRIAFSVGAIIAGIPEVLPVAFFLLVIAVSVVILVASGIQYDQFCKKHPVLSDFYTEQEKDAFRQKFIWLIAGGVGAVLFGVVILVMAFAFLPEQEPYESIMSAVFLLFIAGAVTSFVYAGIMDDKYKIEKYNLHNNLTPEEKKKDDLTGTVCTCIMLTATAIYVGLGFTKGLWATAWWVFPVGGILCGAVSVILDSHKGED